MRIAFKYVQRLELRTPHNYIAESCIESRIGCVILGFRWFPQGCKSSQSRELAGTVQSQLECEQAGLLLKHGGHQPAVMQLHCKEVLLLEREAPPSRYNIFLHSRKRQFQCLARPTCRQQLRGHAGSRRQYGGQRLVSHVLCNSYGSVLEFICSTSVTRCAHTATSRCIPERGVSRLGLLRNSY